MATGFEVTYYRDITRLMKAAERIAASLERLVELQSNPSGEREPSDTDQDHR